MNSAVTVIVPVRNDAQTIIPCLEALLKSTAAAGMEILVVDMGSQDGTGEIVRAFRESRKGTAVLRFFETGGNTGRCHALNSGLLLTRTPYAAVVLPGMETGRHCIERLRAALDENPELFCARAQVREKNRRGQGGKSAAAGQILKSRADSSVQMYRMAALEQTKWFDERLYKGLEAEDLEWRALLCGYRSEPVRNAWARRRSGEKPRSPVDLSVEAGNFLYLMYKNIPGPQQALNQLLMRAVLGRYRRYFAGQGREELYEAAMERAQDLCMDAEMTLARSEEGLGPVGLPLPGVFCLDVQDKRVESIYPLYTGLRADCSMRDLPALARIQAAITGLF